MSPWIVKYLGFSDPFALFGEGFGKESWLALWLTGDAFELWIVMTERFGYLHFFPGQQINKLQRVDDAFALEMIVGDHESCAGMFGDVPDAFCPGFQFVFFVKIVVALGWRNEGIIGEPCVIPAAVEPDVANMRGGALGGFERAANHRLINVAETDFPGVEHSEEFFVVPGAVPYFNDERVVTKAVEEIFQ